MMRRENGTAVPAGSALGPACVAVLSMYSGIMVAKRTIAKITEREEALVSALKTFPVTETAKRHFKILPTDFVLRYGFLFTPTARPKKIQKGTPEECFANAAKLVTAHSELVYCEGYALNAKSGFPIKHAWVTDGSGHAIDNTWTNGVAYAGVPLTRAYVLIAMLKYKVFVSMIDDWEHGHPLLRDLADRPEDWLDQASKGRVALANLR